LPSQTASTVEVKFNPWHDPEDGQFTFANSGRYFGSWLRGGFTGGGGGRFGGGGATGTWDAADKRAKPKASSSQRSRTIGRVEAPPKIVPAPAPVPAGVPSPRASRQSTTAEKLRSVVRNGYEYQIDASGRTRRITGTLTMSETQLRSRRAQAQAGGVDRRTSDDGGHYIAARFNGPTEAFNHFAQDANFNRGRYRALEDQWARAKNGGKQVSGRIVPVYDGLSKRPSTINVWFSVDGALKSVRFSNEHREASLGK